MKQAKRTHQNVSHPPPTAYDSMQEFFPDIKTVVRRIAHDYRRHRQWNVLQTVDPEVLSQEPILVNYTEEYAKRLYFSGEMSRETAVDDANLLGAHLFYMVNYELHHRKTFWVEESLAWMFWQTELDISGDCLRPPFPCCAFIYTDIPTLEVAGTVVRCDPTAAIRSHVLKVLTAYVTQLPGQGDDFILSVSLLFDALAGQWPYILGRDLLIQPHATLEDVLNSHCHDVSPEERDPIFTSSELKRLLHIVVNSILYATTAHLKTKKLVSPVARTAREMEGKGPKKRKRLQHKLAQLRKRYTDDDVFFLPGKIDITQYKHLRELGESTEGRRIRKRFMVRGHWRRANPNWKDRNLRWIEPYWKGPEDAMIVEREYRMKP